MVDVGVEAADPTPSLRSLVLCCLIDRDSPSSLETDLERRGRLRGVEDEVDDKGVLVDAVLVLVLAIGCPS